jgi:hypothetical protein
MSLDPRRRMPDPNTSSGALLYAVLGGLIAALILTLAHHVHLIWS